MSGECRAGGGLAWEDDGNPGPHSVARCRRELGLAPYETEYTWSSPYLTLLLTAEAIESPRDPVSPTTYMIGPCFANRVESDVSLDGLPPHFPLIYISMGTVFTNRPAVLRHHSRVLGCRHSLVVSWRVRTNTCKARITYASSRSVPQLALLPRVDLVICHGGNNTVNETLAAGKPMLVMPVGGEQTDNAERVRYLGAGLRVSTTASAARIRRVADMLLDDPAYRARAQACAAALSQTDGPTTAARCYAHLAQSRQPVLRRDGYPVTIGRGCPMPWETD